MWSYILRRILYAIPILICVNLATFILFFCINTPENIAKSILGEKYVTGDMIHRWKKEHHYHLPLLLNAKDKIFIITGLNKISLDEPLNNVVQTFNIPKEMPEVESIQLLEKIKSLCSNNEIILIESSQLSKEFCHLMTEKLLPIASPMFALTDLEDPSTKIQSKTVRFINQQSFITVYQDLQKTGVNIFTDTLFFHKAVKLFWFDFGKSDRSGQNIKEEILQRMPPSLYISVPAFILGLVLNIFVSMIIAFCRGTFIDKSALVICIALMSMVSLFYYITAQYVLALEWKLFPASGFQAGIDALKFILMPILISIIIEIGGTVRLYRTLFLEEINKDYIRTARAKGLHEMHVLFKHTLKCAMIPIITGVVVAIPGLFTGSLILENFFAIPGLGAYTIEGIRNQDFRVVGSMVYIGSFMYIISLILTDIAYTFVDPRVQLK